MAHFSHIEAFANFNMNFVQKGFTLQPGINYRMDDTEQPHTIDQRIYNLAIASLVTAGVAFALCKLGGHLGLDQLIPGFSDISDFSWSVLRSPVEFSDTLGKLVSSEGIISSIVSTSLITGVVGGALTYHLIAYNNFCNEHYGV